ncbi:MAG: hypothetical protein LW825_01485 [Candidatus Jidaibacter sp.]|nr:hypothetical protein [Candidatus Jidaibacter sp.]
MKSQDMLELLNSGNISFYDLFTNDENNVVDLLEAMREYFSPQAFEELNYTYDNSTNTWEFDSSDKYLEKESSNFFRLLPKEHLPSAIRYLCREEESLSEWVIAFLSERVAFNQISSKEMLEEHIISRGIYTPQTLSNFKYEPDIEAISDARSYGNGYEVSYMLTENAVSFTAFSLAAQYSGKGISEMPSRAVINNISLRQEDIQNDNYLLSPRNLKATLEALNGVMERKPAFLTCSNNGHWATIGLVRDGGTLHILGFDSNQSSMSDEFKRQLVAFIRETNLFVNINDSYIFPQNVQYDNNCGLASALFVASVVSELEKGSDIASLKLGLEEAYLSKIGDPAKAQTWLDLVAEAASLDLSNVEEVQEIVEVEDINTQIKEFELVDEETPRPNYDRNALLFGFLDIQCHRYRFYKQLASVSEITENEFNYRVGKIIEEIKAFVSCLFSERAFLNVLEKKSFDIASKISEVASREQQEEVYNKVMGEFSPALTEYLSDGYKSLLKEDQNLEASR